MAINGYYVGKSFFTGMPMPQKVTFYLTDGGRDLPHSQVMRVKDVIVSIDLDNNLGVVNVPNAYGGKPFIAELDLETNGLTILNEFIKRDVMEWLGLRQEWRKVGSSDKVFTFIVIQDGEMTVDYYAGASQN